MALPAALTGPNGGVAHHASPESQNVPLRDSNTELMARIMDVLISKQREVWTYIPNNDISWRPLNSDLKILPQANMIVQEFQQVITFLLLVPDYVSSDWGK